MNKPKVYFKNNVAVLVVALEDNQKKHEDFAKTLGDTYDSMISEGWFPHSCTSTNKTLTQIFVRKDNVQKVIVTNDNFNKANLNIARFKDS